MDNTNSQAPQLVVYGDFADPWSYLASQRIDALQEAGLDIAWRAIERHPRTPVKGRRLDAQTRAEAARVLEEVRAQCGPDEFVPVDPPDLVPKTEAAVSAHAEAVGAGVADQVRRRLFAAYWEDGVNIGDPEVLRTLLAGDFIRGHATSDPVRRFGYAVAMTRAPITTAAWRRIKQSRERWSSLHQAELPTVVEGGVASSGQRACEYLGVRVARHRRSPAAPSWLVARDIRVPVGAVHPPATWLTQVGDPWQRESRLSSA
ncbi:DsbA family oxidoreductase [Segeticoccus rhizosphaerae]|jgi:2-hydroxychromene-2-carboxylate isomerase|uniref:DsbA family oxidoreductase n=1 Tax=Segeticoccus rhizosphaerae TaxID=1104777 RepID=UPI00138FCF18|nr:MULTISPECIES: DsbA family protein [Intrasporangiaceae]